MGAGPGRAERGQVGGAFRGPPERQAHLHQDQIGPRREQGLNQADQADQAEAFLSELAHRVAVGVASVCVVLDPGVVVLGGEVGRAGGTALADRVAAGVASIWPSRPRVVPTGVPGEPVLRGAMLAAVAQARAALLASVADPQ